MSPPTGPPEEREEEEKRETEGEEEEMGEEEAEEDEEDSSEAERGRTCQDPETEDIEKGRWEEEHSDGLILYFMKPQVSEISDTGYTAVCNALGGQRSEYEGQWEQRLEEAEERGRDKYGTWGPDWLMWMGLYHHGAHLRMPTASDWPTDSYAGLLHVRFKPEEVKAKRGETLQRIKEDGAPKKPAVWNVSEADDYWTASAWMAYRRINVSDGLAKDEVLTVIFDTCVEEEAQLYWYHGICREGLKELLWEFGYDVMETLVLDKDAENAVKTTSMITSLETLGASVSGTKAASNPSAWFGLVDLPQDLDLEKETKWKLVEPEIKWNPTAEEIKAWAVKNKRRSLGV